MIGKRLERAFLVLATGVLLSANTLNAQMSFKKVEARTAFGHAKEGDKGRLVIEGESITFANDKGRAYFSIPSQAVTEVFYSRVSGRRIKTAIMVTPLLLFSKGKKHYLTLSFDDGKDLVGAVEFRLHKSNYRGVLRAVEQVSGQELKFEQEGIKDEKENIAVRSRSAAEMATLEITSTPDGAEIEIDGAFAGTTPRAKILKPGEYNIKIEKKGYKKWERKMKLEAGETVPLKVELEKN